MTCKEIETKWSSWMLLNKLNTLNKDLSYLFRLQYEFYYNDVIRKTGSCFLQDKPNLWELNKLANKHKTSIDEQILLFTDISQEDVDDYDLQDELNYYLKKKYIKSNRSLFNEPNIIKYRLTKKGLKQFCAKEEIIL